MVGSRAKAQGMSLTTALANTSCIQPIAANPPNQAVPAALFISSTTPCGNVTISTTDTTPFTAASPLMPVVIGSGGALTIQDPGAGQAMTLYASSFLIQNTGTMQAGTVSNPVVGQITIAMAGNSSAALPPTTGDTHANARDITVMDGGVLALYGGKGLSAAPDGTHNNPVSNPAFINTVSGTKSWTYLVVPAGPAKYNDAENVSAPVPTTNPDITLTLATTVDWQIKDWVSVATTSFSSHQTEIVQICGIQSVANPEASAKNPIPGVPANVSQLTLCNKLKHYHYGGLAPTPGFFPAGTKQVVAKGGSAIDVSRQAKSFYDDHHRNYGIDERAEVALLSRNIKLTSVAGQSTDANNFIGGHLVAMVTGTSNPTLTLVGVEIEKFGQALVGRYPVHLHKLPSGNNVLIQDVSVHHSYNKCYVVHGTGNANFYNNVCVRTIGQGVYLEDGTGITGNQFMRNFIAGTMAAQATYSYPQQNGSLYWDGDNLQGSHANAGLITNATNASPIVVTSPNNLPTGAQVTISGVNGNTAANGSWTVTNIDSGHFSLNGSTGNGSFSPYSGTWSTSGLNAITSISQDLVSKRIVIQTQSAPVTGAQVTIKNVNATVNGTWTVTNTTTTGAPQFALNGTQGISPGSYSCCVGTWTATGNITNATNTSPIVITSSNSVATAAQVTITGVPGNTAANGPWSVTNTNNSLTQFSLNGSTGNGTYSSGTWQAAPVTITGASNASPIVITSASAPVTGAQVTISGVPGNTAANGSWTVTNIDATHFSLNGSTGNGVYTNGGTWLTSNTSPTWYTVNNIPDTSASGANGSVGPDISFPGGFWITNLGNTFVNNSVAGCQAEGRGYWLLTQNGQRYAYPEFTGNRAHGCYNGMDANVDTVNAVNPAPTMNGTEKDQAPVVLLNDNTVTRSRQRAFWGRGIFFTLHNNRFATNPYGFSLLGGGGPEGNLPGFWGMAHENVIAGMTRNNVERYPGCVYGTVPVGPSGANLINWQTECTDVALNFNASPAAAWGNYPGTSMNIQGYSYYDGPARIEHNRFVNFRFDPTGIQSDPAARLLTKTDIQNIAANGMQGQLEGIVTQAQAAPNSAPSANYQGYAGDPASGWIQSNQQAVPPTQYIQDSIWDNVDFKHQVYTEAVNMGPFNDGDKTTVILDKDSQLTGLKVVDKSGKVSHAVVPVSLNNLDYYATDFTVDEPHARGPNDFRATSLMSPHKYATLNIESAANPAPGFRVVIQRDLAAYGSTVYPSLFLNGRGQKPIYEPFVMDRMGYTVYGMTGTENEPTTQAPSPFMPQLLFSYTDPAVKKAGDYFVNRIAVYQPVTTPASINVYRVRRQWGQQYTGGVWPPHYNPPLGNSCDGVFFAGASSWADCLKRANNQSPYNASPYTQLGYPYGMTLKPAADWKSFDKSYKDLLAGNTTVASFIANQTFYYDQTTSMLYFYMIEDSPVQRLHEPYGTCGGGAQKYATNVAKVQQIKSFSDPGSVKAALDASCQVAGGTWQSSSSAITNATNASPIVVTSPNSLSPGDKVTIAGVQGNTAANGTWTITTIDATHFSLNNSLGNGTYTTGSGTWSHLHPITNATNASPIVVTSPNSLTTGAQVTIAGVQGNTAANGTWTITTIDASHFSLNGSAGNGAYTKLEPQPDDLFTCGEIGCAAYLVDLSAAVVTAPSACSPCVPAHPIPSADYRAWNQYTLVYGTSKQQPNGLPVVANAAVGNTPPPPDGQALTGAKTPTDGTPPPTGDQVTYSFLPLSGSAVTVTENFRYRCVTTPPWAPVNARGAYPPTGGFTYPLGPSVCMAAAQGSAVMEAGVVLEVIVTNPGSGYTSAPTITITPPTNGMTAQAVATISNGSVTGVTMTNQGSGYDFGPQVTFSPPGP